MPALLAVVCVPALLAQAPPAVAGFLGVRNGGLPVCLLVNQVGYDEAAAKVLVVQSTDGAQAMPAEFQIVDDRERVVFTGPLAPRGGIHEGTPADWGAHYWTGDFSALRIGGRYRARILTGQTWQGPDKIWERPEQATSFWFRIGPQPVFRTSAVAAARFFYWQRCGFALPGVHEACHLDDARIPAELGGGHRDVTGGWHDAGDYNKYNGFTPHSVYALATLADDGRPLLSDDERRQAIDEACWGADFVLKMWQRGKGLLYRDVWSTYQFWGRPDEETDGISGNGDDRPIRGEGPNPMAAAALARLARLTGRDDYRDAALDLWRGANADEARTDRPIFLAELLLADLELSQLTGDVQYRQAADRHVGQIMELQGADGVWPPNITSQGLPPAALVGYAQALPGAEKAAEATASLRRWLQRSRQLAENPFQITPWAENVFFFPAKNPSDWYTGQNSQYLSQAWALYLAGNLLKDDDAFRLADRQIDWVLGANPADVCMLEGQGSFNFPSYAHRFMGRWKLWAPTPGWERGAIPGMIPNGLRRVAHDIDKPWSELVINPTAQPDWRSLEAWIPHNAFYLLAVTGQMRSQRK